MPYMVVLEAKRGVGATDPMTQLLGAMLCAAKINERDGAPAREIHGCFTVADIWPFLRGTIAWTEPRPEMRVLLSREHMERTEAPAILAILKFIVGRAVAP